MRLQDLPCPNHERLVRVTDEACGLTGFIAIHSTRCGPAVGGLRFHPYAAECLAIEDVLRLSRGMTFKNAAAGLALGGGKSVIIGDPGRDKAPTVLRAMGEAVKALRGAYWVAEDMGVGPADMEVLAGVCDFVAGRSDGDFASGDPSPLTARGVMGAIRVTLRHATGSDRLKGRRIAVQGLGSVGHDLGLLLLDAGAELVVTDVDRARAAAFALRPGVTAVGPDEIYDAEADLFAPCAIGAILNDRTIPRLRVRAVAGSANNQLARDTDGPRLAARGVLYAPDYLVNAGGVINVATEVLTVPDRAAFVDAHLGDMERLLDRVLAEARRTGGEPGQIADRIVAQRLMDAAA